MMLLQRFNVVARWYCVANGILFLVSISVSMATGIDITIIIVCMRVFIAFYTVMGGIEAVIWTDVFSWIGMYSNDQTIVQRYVAAKSTKARRPD